MKFQYGYTSFQGNTTIFCLHSPHWPSSEKRYIRSALWSSVANDWLHLM